MNTNIIFSSNSDEWTTPDNIFNILNEEFHFTLDPCSTVQNHKTPKYYTILDDGLNQSWKNEIVFVNPPYSQISNWIRKAYIEYINNNTRSVLLLPVRTDTKYFHSYINNIAEIRFIKGRLKFNNHINSAPFPSMIVIY